MDKFDSIIQNSGIGDVDRETYAMLKLLAYRAYYGDRSRYYTLLTVDDAGTGRITVDKKIKELIAGLALFILGSIHFGIHRGETALLSDSLLQSERYSDVVLDMLDDHRVVSFLNYGSVFGFLRSDRKVIDTKRFRSRSIYVGPYICGYGFIEQAIRIYDIFFDVVSGNGGTVGQDLVRKFSQTINARKKRIVRQLIRRKVSCFVTVNQYNAPDLLTIMACKECGIVTKELQHRSLILLPTDLFTQFPHFCYAEVDSVWCQADTVWSQTYFKTSNLLYDTTSYEVVGCPEISHQEYNAYLNKYARERSVVLFAPAMSDYDVTQDYTAAHKDGENVEDYVRWRRHIYDAVSSFAEVNQLKVYIRFHPGIKLKNIDYADHEYLKGRSFEILGYSREDFFRAICSCRYAISMSSSSLFMAYQYGCRCICIDEKGTHDFCGLDIKSLRIDELFSYAVGDEGLEKITPDCFDASKLFSR